MTSDYSYSLLSVNVLNTNLARLTLAAQELEESETNVVNLALVFFFESLKTPETHNAVMELPDGSCIKGHRSGND